jgi:hypothetical protein
MMKLIMMATIVAAAFSAEIFSTAFVPNSFHREVTRSKSKDVNLFGFFDDLMKGNIGNGDEKEAKDKDDELNEADFRNEIQKREVESAQSPAIGNLVTATGAEIVNDEIEEQEFDGYMVGFMANMQVSQGCLALHFR